MNSSLYHFRDCIISFIEGVKNFVYLYKNEFKVNQSRHKQCGITPHFSIEKNYTKNLLKKILRGITNWEKFFDRFADHKQVNIPWLINFNISVTLCT